MKKRHLLAGMVTALLVIGSCPGATGPVDAEICQNEDRDPFRAG